MSDIAPITGPSAASLSSPSAVQRQAATVDAPARSSDRAEISKVAQLLSKLADLDVRQDKIDAVRAQIAAGNYVTDDKIEAAIDELLSDLTPGV